MQESVRGVLVSSFCAQDVHFIDKMTITRQLKDLLGQIQSNSASLE